MSVTVREATPEDAEALPAVHGAAIRRLAAAAYDEAVIDAWDADRSPEDYPVGEEDVHFVVARREGAVVGFGEVRPDPPEYLGADAEGEVRAVYVHPDAAGEGVGTAIYDDLERWARRREVGSLGLLASVNAVPFYEARGFESVAETTHEFGGAVEGPAVEMRKVLSGAGSGGGSGE